MKSGLMTRKSEKMVEKTDKNQKKEPGKVKITGEIKYGEVLLADWDDAEGYEQQGPRPVVVVSNNKQNERKRVMVVVPLTRAIRPYPFQASTFFHGIPGKAKCEQVRALTIERFEKRKGFLTPEEMTNISDKLLLVLNLANNISDERLLIILKRRIETGRISWNDILSLFD